MTFYEKLEKRIWNFLYRFFPTFQRFFLRFRIVHHYASGRIFHIGWLAPQKTLWELYEHLKPYGFGNHFIAWVNTGQVLSLRKLTDFRDQYHLEVFEDGEICGHFEVTPESHPIDHMRMKGLKNTKEDFLKFLGDFVVEEKTANDARLCVDPRLDFLPEITIDSKY